MRKPITTDNIKGLHKRNENANYRIGADCTIIAETERLDEAIQIMEKNLPLSDIYIHEYISGNTWYF